MDKERKTAQWSIDESMGDASNDSFVSTSSLQYINEQLVSHGFAPAPGISLDGIANTDSERVVRCLLALLSQRVEDMARTEELSTRLRTVSYDHERLTSMYQTANEKSANAEREANLQKSRMNGMAKTLQENDNAHKQTAAELQRTKSALLSVRSAHQAELRRKEKEVERLNGSWQKIADTQARLQSTRSGIRQANYAVVDGSEYLNGGNDLLESALTEAENDCKRLRQENQKLKEVVLNTVNEIQSSIYHVRSLGNDHVEDSTPYNFISLFPMNSVAQAESTISCIIYRLRDLVSRIGREATNSHSITLSDNGIKQLQDMIASLRAQLKKTEEESSAHAAETQTLFEKLSTEQVKLSRAENANQQDEIEKNQFAEAALELSREREKLEARRREFQDEKRTWEAQQMLSHLPPPSPVSSPSRSKRNSPRRSLKKSVAVGKAGNNGPRKASKRSPTGLLSSSRVDPPYETAYIPSSSSFGLRPLGNSLLPTSFALPPPPDFSSPVFESSPNPPAKEVKPTALLAESDPLAAPQGPNTNSGPPRKPTILGKHAFSPARPSPLSRILMLGNSPTGPDGTPLEALMEEDLLGIDENSMDVAFPAIPIASQSSYQRRPSLAEELGVDEDYGVSDHDNQPPAKGKRSKVEGANQALGPGAKGSTSIRAKPSRKPDKEKPKPDTNKASGKRPARDALEKENGKVKMQRVSANKITVKSNGTGQSAPTATSTKASATSVNVQVKTATTKTTVLTTSKATVMAEVPTGAPRIDGPRRVPAKQKP